MSCTRLSDYGWMSRSTI